MDNTNKLVYWVTTGLFCLLMLMFAVTHFLKYDDVAAIFSRLGYPTYLITPIAVLKILGIVAILTKRSAFLKEWAYAGFFFLLVLAASSSQMRANDSQSIMAIGGLILLLVSYIYDKKVFAGKD